MLPGDRHEVDGQGFASLAWAVRRAIERVRAKDIPEPEVRAWIGQIEAQYRTART